MNVKVLPKTHTRKHVETRARADVRVRGASIPSRVEFILLLLSQEENQEDLPVGEMAEASSQDNLTAEEKEESEAEKESPQQTPVPPQKREEEEELECAVCLQKCVHPVRLPCSHIFCFLCVKGVANQSKRCAMCRQEIPADFLDHPTLLSSIEAEKEEVLPGGYQWFYEGRNGWWRYDERTNTDIEEAYAQGETSLTLLIAGYNYDIDLTNMRQARADCPGLRRRIKRDVVSSSAKGTAGLSTKLFRGQGGRGRSRGRKRKCDDKD